jgi:hypothetical protein
MTVSAMSISYRKDMSPIFNLEGYKTILIGFGWVASQNTLSSTMTVSDNQIFNCSIDFLFFAYLLELILFLLFQLLQFAQRVRFRRLMPLVQVVHKVRFAFASPFSFSEITVSRVEMGVFRGVL